MNTILQNRLSALDAKHKRVAVNKHLRVFYGWSRVNKIRKKEVKCLVCGEAAVYPKERIKAFADADEYVCPYCGATSTMERLNRDTKTRECKHFTIITTFRGYQVARTWEVWRCNYSNQKYASYNLNEIFQIWITPEGKEVITGRQCHRSVYSLTWDFHKPLDIRQHNASTTGYWQMEDVYDISGNVLYPDIRVTPLIKRNGWTKKLMRFQNFFALTDAMRWLLSVPTAEMLVKTGQLDLFLHMLRRKDREIPFLHAIRIANRNGYIVEDASMWLDMLTMAAELGMDTHNPKVVCPANLKEAHDSLLKPIANKREKERKKQARMDADAWETKYRETKGKYFGLCFGNESIVITVIQSVADMEEEGKAMHHCVYNAAYYKREDALILSARDAQGNRLETIEVNLRTFKVEQSRAVCNGVSPQHAAIVQLVQQNMGKIRKLTEAEAA